MNKVKNALRRSDTGNYAGNRISNTVPKRAVTWCNGAQWPFQPLQSATHRLENSCEERFAGEEKSLFARDMCLNLKPAFLHHF